MKKTSILAVLGVCVLTACTDGPKESLQGYLDCLQQKNYEGLVEGMHFKKTPTEADKKMLSGMIQGKQEQAEQKGEGITSYKALEDSILVEDSLAIVKYETVFADGTSKQDDQKMVKVDGKWLMDSGK